MPKLCHNAQNATKFPTPYWEKNIKIGGWFGHTSMWDQFLERIFETHQNRYLFWWNKSVAQLKKQLYIWDHASGFMYKTLPLEYLFSICRNSTNSGKLVDPQFMIFRTEKVCQVSPLNSRYSLIMKPSSLTKLNSKFLPSLSTRLNGLSAAIHR